MAPAKGWSKRDKYSLKSHRHKAHVYVSRLPDLSGVQEVNSGLGRSLRELREAIIRVRLIPVAEIFARMPFVVRDFSRQKSETDIEIVNGIEAIPYHIRAWPVVGVLFRHRHRSGQAYALDS